MCEKRYIVKLSPEEREQLERLISKGKSAAKKQLKARILLHADESEAGSGWNDTQISEALCTYPVMAYRVRQQCVEEGLEAVFTRKKRKVPPIARLFDGEKEARLISLACSQAPSGYASWTLRLLANKVVELGIVPQASHTTVGRVLKKTRLNRT
jgi:Homeodomain-like domain